MTCGRRRLLPAAAAALLLAGCSSFTAAPPAAVPGAASRTPADPCPAEPVAPDPDRPVVALDMTLADDLRTVTGTETVAFTPDLATDELVFRLVPNAPGSVAAGSSLRVDDVRGPDVVAGRYEPAGAAGPGGLYVVRLRDELAAGETTEVELDVTLELGRERFDRLGAGDGFAWWASGFPLLAWEPGVGWARDPFVEVLGETTTSPAMDTTVQVSVPEGLTVLMTGDQDEPGPVRAGRRTWTATEPVARDVSVAVGAFRTAEVDVDGVRVTAGVLPGAVVEPGALAEQTRTAMEGLTARFGTFPYRTLTVPLLPSYGGGIEYPSSILMMTRSTEVLVHEVAHMWFYGMVGGSQFRDPWLDESFASYAEAVGSDPQADAVAAALAVPGDVGASMAEAPDDERYSEVVYGKGGAALLTARQAAGAQAFDDALRCYVNAQAWTVATPDDVATALADLPRAVEVLVAAGALDADDLAGSPAGTSAPAGTTD